MDNKQDKQEEIPLWKRPIIIVYGLIAIAGMAVLVYISLLYDFSPMTNALIGAVIASVIGFLSPRPSHEGSSENKQGDNNDKH